MAASAQSPQSPSSALSVAAKAHTHTPPPLHFQACCPKIFRMRIATAVRLELYRTLCGTERSETVLQLKNPHVSQQGA